MFSLSRECANRGLTLAKVPGLVGAVLLFLSISHETPRTWDHLSMTTDFVSARSDHGVGEKDCSFMSALPINCLLKTGAETLGHMSLYTRICDHINNVSVSATWDNEPIHLSSFSRILLLHPCIKLSYNAQITLMERLGFQSRMSMIQLCLQSTSRWS